MSYGATASGTRLHTVATVRGRSCLRVAVCGRTLPRHLSWTGIMARKECQDCRRIINKAYDIVNPDADPWAEVIYIPAHRIVAIARQGSITNRQRQALRKRQEEEERRAQARRDTITKLQRQALRKAREGWEQRDRARTVSGSREV